MKIDPTKLEGRIIGPYELIQRKGDPSAQGIVYLGKNLHTGLYAAVKILVKLKDWQKLQFDTETYVHCAVGHPNIVDVQYFGYDHIYDVHLIATNFVKGLSLAKILGIAEAPVCQHGPVSFDRAIHVVTLMTGALSHLHSRSICHLDIKPSNIMTEWEENDSVIDKNIFLIDFGFATWAENGSAGEHAAFGTINYKAPEQIKGRDLTEKTDIYQLGIVIFEMLTGHRPFFDKTKENVELNIVHDPIPEATALNKSLEKSIDTFFLKVLAKTPNERFSTVEEMFDEFMKCSPATLRRTRSQIPQPHVKETPRIQWTRSADEVNLAFTSKGSKYPLIFLPPWVSNQALLWANDILRGFLNALADRCQLIAYDKRGCGLTKPRDIKHWSVDDQVNDLDALVRHLSLKKVALLGISAGGPIAIKYAARFPDKVSRLILYGTYASGKDILTPDQKEAQLALVKGYWGREECAGFFFELFGGPSGMQEIIRRYLLASSSREHAFEFLRQIYEVDVTEDARKVDCPTLILHRRSDRAIPCVMAEQLATLIRDNTLRTFEGRSHLPWIGDWVKESKPIVENTLGFLPSDIG